MCKFCGFDQGFLHHAAMGVVLLVLTVNVVSVSAVPQAPNLPSEFRTTFNVSQGNNPLGHVRTWYDADHKMQRFDIFDYNSFGWTVTINRFDLSTPMQYNLTRSFNNWICFPGKLTVPMMAPNFLASSKYLGTATVDNQKVNQWQDTTGRVWSTAVAAPQPLVGMNLADGKTSVVFGKINAETIDASIFALPKACGSGAHIQREGSLIFGL